MYTVHGLEHASATNDDLPLPIKSSTRLLKATVIAEINLHISAIEACLQKGSFSDWMSPVLET